MECCKVFENKYANRKYHQAWLRALKQAILGGDSAEQESEKHLLQEAWWKIIQQLVASQPYVHAGWLDKLIW